MRKWSPLKENVQIPFTGLRDGSMLWEWADGRTEHDLGWDLQAKVIRGTILSGIPSH